MEPLWAPNHSCGRRDDKGNWLCLVSVSEAIHLISTALSKMGDGGHRTDVCVNALHATGGYVVENTTPLSVPREGLATGASLHGGAAESAHRLERWCTEEADLSAHPCRMTVGPSAVKPANGIILHIAPCRATSFPKEGNAD